MNSITRFLVLVSSFACIGACATTSAEAQSRAQAHQYKSDQAAARGFYGAAANEQRKAADAHQDAVDKAIKEGVAIPAQPQPGDGNPTVARSDQREAMHAAYTSSAARNAAS